MKRFDFDAMKNMGGAEYARSEAWDIVAASNAIAMVAQMSVNESQEPDDMQSLGNIIKSLMEFINGEIIEMIAASKRGKEEESFVPYRKLDISYVKSLGVDIPENKLAVKYVSKNVIAHPVFIWGDAKKTDLEMDFFTQESNFWDESLKNVERPLTWDHGQDELFAQFEKDPVIGKTVKYYDDPIARWAESVINTDKLYRKYIDQFIEEKRLGYSSDSAPQYVIRVPQGKATWIKSWPWFGGSLTVSPCEPRMKQDKYTPDFLKSLGIVIPDVSTQTVTWDNEMAILDYYKTIYK